MLTYTNTKLVYDGVQVGATNLYLQNRESKVSVLLTLFMLVLVSILNAIITDIFECSCVLTDFDLFVITRNLD